MKQTINKSEFRDAFFNMGRSDNFSYEALGQLYDYYDEIEGYDLDVVEICCDWTEDSIKSALKAYGFDELKELAWSTTVIKIDDDTVLYRNY